MTGAWLAFAGAAAGLLARPWLPGGRRLGVVLAAVLGAAGALLAAWAGTALGLGPPGSWPVLAAAAGGAVAAVLAVGRLSG